jgi:hypothetical protein
MLKKILGLVAISFLFAWPVSILAWDDCPRGEVDCTGECGLFIDTDGDGLCDHSQPAPEDRVGGVTATAYSVEESEPLLSIEPVVESDLHDLISGSELKKYNVSEIADLYGIGAQDYALALSQYLGKTIKVSDSFQLLKDNYGLEPSIAKDIAVSVFEKKDFTDVATEKEIAKPIVKRVYHLLPIFGVLVFFYILTHILSKKNKITVATHRKIWNILLTVTFLASGLLGILLVIRINFGISIPLPFNMLYWHVEFGIAMTAISIFHIIWHWPYYRGLVR